MDTRTIIELSDADLEAVPQPTPEDEDATARVELAMAATAKAVEAAFDTARAQAVGAMFDAIVNDAIELGDPTGAQRATRVMRAALAKLAAGGRDSHTYDRPDEISKLYTKTPRNGLPTTA